MINPDKVKMFFCFFFCFLFLFTPPHKFPLNLQLSLAKFCSLLKNFNINQNWNTGNNLAWYHSTVLLAVALIREHDTKDTADKHCSRWSKLSTATTTDQTFLKVLQVYYWLHSLLPFWVVNLGLLAPLCLSEWECSSRLTRSTLGISSRDSVSLLLDSICSASFCPISLKRFSFTSSCIPSCSKFVEIHLYTQHVKNIFTYFFSSIPVRIGFLLQATTVLRV